jgi:sugar lactone lactonase YvrE
VGRLMRWVLVVSTTVVAGCNAAPDTSAYRVEPLLPRGSPFHGVHGLRFDDEGRLYATSVIGQSIFRLDPATGAIARFVGPPEGMADDLAFAADGTLVWTAIEDGIIYAKPPDGPIRRVVDNRKGVNAISFSPDRKRLYFSLVFYGDALYELYLDDSQPPRLIADNLGGLNAFQVGEDGMIYGPLMFGGRVVRIDPDTAEIATISSDFSSPGALKLDFKGNAYVLDGSSLKRLDLSSGAITASVDLPADADNLAIDSNGGVLVSMAAPNSIARVDVDAGTLRYVVRPSALNSPTGLAVANDGSTETVYVGDLFGGVRRIDGTTGALEETPPIELFQPSHVAVAGDDLIAVSQVFGTVQRLNRKTLEVLATWEGFSSPGDAVETANGDIVVADTGNGRVVRITGPEPADRTVLASGLAAPTGLALAPNGALYVTETGGGRVLRLGTDPTRPPTVFAVGLSQPEGLAARPNGDVVVMETGAKQLTVLSSAGATVIAKNLPVHLSDGPSLYRGVAASATAIYFSSDVDNTVYKVLATP